MALILSEIKKLNTSSSAANIQALLFYPKVLIFENNTTILVIDLEQNNLQCESYLYGEEIVDKLLVQSFLWIIFNSGKIIVIDILRNKQIHVLNENNILLNINQIMKNNDYLHFTSVSGDSFQIQISINELTQKLCDSTDVLSVTFKKVPGIKVHGKTSNMTSGLNIYIEAGQLWVKCPLTGLTEVINNDLMINYVSVWNDLVVVASDTNMWIMDLKEAQVIHEFGKTEANYYPLMAYNDVFIYLLWTYEEVKIYSAGVQQMHMEDHTGSTNNSDSLNKIKTSQETLKTQLRSIVKSVTPNTKHGEVLPQLQPLIDAIEDFIFLIEIIQELCHHNIMFKSILYPLQKRIFETNDTHLTYLINDLSIKIDLIEYIHFTGNNGYEDVNLYQQDFKELCITFISKSDFDIASICWLKYSQLNFSVSSESIVNILNSINTSAKIASIIIWLKNFVPSLLEQNPFYIDMFVRWASERIFMLEQSPYWPKIGLKFVDEVTSILENSFSSISVRPVSLDDLDVIKTRITYIMDLKEKYKINMLLNELSSQNPNEVALIMLRRTYTEDLKIFLEEYLPSYSLQHLLDVDNILSTYIENEAASSGGGIDGVRLKLLLDCFHSHSNKLECLLQVLKVLDVPWNSTVLDLAVNSVATATKNFTISDAERLLSYEIQKEIHYANVKVVLKKNNFPMTCTDYKLVLNKIVNSPFIELEDLRTIMCIMPAYTNFGSILYIERCLKDCEVRTALSYFNNLAVKDKKLLIKAVVAKYDQILSGPQNNLMVERNYIDFIKGTKLVNNIEIDKIETLYYFKNSYNLLVSINDMYNEKACEYSVYSWIHQDGNSASSGRGGSVIQLTQACKSQYSVLMSLLQRTSTCHEVRKLVEYLLRTFSGKDVLIEDFIAALSQFQFGENCDILLKSYNVLIDLAVSCSEEHLHDLNKQLYLLNTFINASIIVKNLSIAWKFHYVFLPIASGTAIKELILFFSSKQSCNTTEIDYMNISSKCDFTTLRMISNITLTSCEARPTWYDDISDTAKRLLAKIIAFQEFDEVLVTNLILVIKMYEGNNSWLFESLRGQNECLPPNILGYLSSPPIKRIFIFDDDTFNKEISNSVSYPPQYILKTKFNINLADVALTGNSEETWDGKVILFYVLLKYPNTCFDRLVELCRSLNISANDGLSLQLIALLATWEVKYKIHVDDLGHRQILFENDEQQLNRCFVVWDSIENKDFLKDILTDFWKSGEVTLHGRLVAINPYYYETFLCIYRLIYRSSTEVRNTKEYFLLHYLKEYTRQSSPKQYEYELFSVKGMFPEIGHFRLPFHLFMREDMWSNLKSEITLDTYERWIPAVALLALDSDIQTAKDIICSNAVKQTMTTGKFNDVADTNNKHEPWRLTSKEEPLLRAAHRCVKHIANMEWAGACLFYVLQGCARGADQVAAAHLCYQFAQRWAALQPGNRAVRQMERMHANLSTRHALNKIEWARDEFLKLLAEPSQLIRTMYLHPDFISKMSRYDVNRTVNEIADKNGINVSSIRIQILENILEKSNTAEKTNTVLSTKDLMTAKCILKSTCPKMGAIYLSRIAFDDEIENNKCKKLRALQCLMSVVDSDTAIKVTNRQRDALWISLIELLSVVYLESIDMPWIASAFAHDKTRALEQLLQAVDGNINGIRIAAKLAFKFGSPQLIRTTIPLLLRASLYEEMIPLLLKLSSRLDSVICSAWRAVILSPFQRADYPITERQRRKCLNAVNLLPICPIIKDEDLVEIWKNCLRCKCVGLGCLILPYMTTQTRQSLGELHKIDRRNLIISLKNLHSETYLVSGAMHVIEKMASRAYR